MVEDTLVHYPFAFFFYLCWTDRPPREQTLHGGSSGKHLSIYIFFSLWLRHHFCPLQHMVVLEVLFCCMVYGFFHVVKYSVHVFSVNIILNTYIHGFHIYNSFWQHWKLEPGTWRVKYLHIEGTYLILVLFLSVADCCWVIILILWLLSIAVQYFVWRRILLFHYYHQRNECLSML